MSNIPEPYFTAMKDAAYVQYKTAAGRRQIHPEGIAVLMADGTIFPGRSNEQVKLTAAQDAIGHLKDSFHEVAHGQDPIAKQVAAIVVMTSFQPAQFGQTRPDEPTAACLEYLRSYPGIGSCNAFQVIAAHDPSVTLDFKL